MVLQKLVGAKPFTPPQILWFVNSKGEISFKAAEENKLKSQEVMVPSNCMQISKKSWRQLLKSSECGDQLKFTDYGCKVEMNRNL